MNVAATINPGTMLVTFAAGFVLLFVVLIFVSRRSGRSTGFKPPTIAPSKADAIGARLGHFITTALATLILFGVTVAIWIASVGAWYAIPFGLFGLGFFAWMIHAGLRLLNPVIVVEFDHMPLRPGERCDVTYSLSGNFLALRNLVFTLEGREKVTYRQGTDIRTEAHVAWRLPLLESTNNAQYERGKFTITLPADVMTTFMASNNQFTWHLCCRGDIPGRPDIKDDFDVTVLGNALTRGAK